MELPEGLPGEEHEALRRAHMSEESIIDRHRKYLFPCVSTSYEEPLVLSRGSGKYLYDEAGSSFWTSSAVSSPSDSDIAILK